MTQPQPSTESAPRDKFELMNRGLGRVHGVIRKSTQNIISRAKEVVGTREAADFLKYVETYIQFITDHHHHEDIIFLPAYQKKGTDVNLYEKDHKDLHDVLDSFGSYVTELKKSGKPSVAYTAEAATKVSGFAEQIK
ncbi:hypothetical protein HDU93_005821, partial [Gonapodya sp. JEL0774]